MILALIISTVFLTVNNSFSSHQEFRLNKRDIARQIFVRITSLCAKLEMAYVLAAIFADFAGTDSGVSFSKLRGS